jgi:hypothetical protein
LTPCACNRWINAFQLDASTNAPCTSTTVGCVVAELLETCEFSLSRMCPRR